MIAVDKIDDYRHKCNHDDRNVNSTNYGEALRMTNKGLGNGSAPRRLGAGGRQEPPRRVGRHRRPEPDAGAPAPSGLSAEGKRAYEELLRTFKQVDYAKYMASRPQTLYGIADSPVGLAGWLLDHNDADGQPAAAVVSALNRTTSATGELTRDEILDNITLYWLTNTGVSVATLLGIQGRLFQRQRRQDPGGRDRLSQRAI